MARRSTARRLKGRQANERPAVALDESMRMKTQPPNTGGGLEKQRARDLHGERIPRSEVDVLHRMLLRREARAHVRPARHLRDVAELRLAVGRVGEVLARKGHAPPR